MVGTGTAPHPLLAAVGPASLGCRAGNRRVGHQLSGHRVRRLCDRQADRGRSSLLMSRQEWMTMESFDRVVAGGCAARCAPAARSSRGHCCRGPTVRNGPSMHDRAPTPRLPWAGGSASATVAPPQRTSGWVRQVRSAQRTG